MKADAFNKLDGEHADRVAYLVAGYIRQTLTEKEHDELDEWITASDENQKLFEELTDPAMIQKGLNEMETIDVGGARARVASKIKFTDQVLVKPKKRWINYSAAASIIIVTGLVIFFMVNKKSKAGKEVVKTEEIKPGGNYASLTLSNGKVINLSEAKNGMIDSTNGNEVLKSTEGQISYESHAPTIDAYHILTTPAGGQYSVTLPDGSRVWLNSLSSLKYPVSFSENERVVELSGEGYFEVAPSSSPEGGGQRNTPFIVKVKGMKVEVLGTHFNVNSYEDEDDARTTLLEGKVRVSHKQNTEVLNPGEQASVGKNGEISVIKNIHTDEVTGWKNGMFIFKDKKIEDIMRQVGRWYDAEIVYEGKVEHHFNATIYRKESLDKLLSVLEETDRVHFRVEGKKIFVR